MTTPRSEFLRGINGILPILLGVIPFGMIYGVTAASAGIAPLLAQAISCIIFSGSAQLITAQLVAAAVPAPVIILTNFIVNIRHVLYSASLSPYLSKVRPLWRWLLAYSTIKESGSRLVVYHKMMQLFNDTYLHMNQKSKTCVSYSQAT